jgi:hypothetical protein
MNPSQKLHNVIELREIVITHSEESSSSQGCFSSPRFARAQIDGYVFWDQNLCIVSDAHSPISLTGIDKIKHLSIIHIHIILYS